MIEPGHAKRRLENVRSVQPILSALRSISLGSWQAALDQGARVRQYGERLAALLPLLLPHLPRLGAAPGGETRFVLLVVGSERGLCGRFNTAVVERAERHLAALTTVGAQVALAALGTRTRRLLQRRGHALADWNALSITALPPLELAFGLVRGWLARYEAGELDAVDVVYNAYRRAGHYETAVVRLLPPRLPVDRPGAIMGAACPPIVETDPLSLYVRLIEQWVAAALQRVLLESAAAEHAARYELMEAAARNAEELIAELTLAIQTARQQAVTREMQELAVGAGMIGRATRK